MDHEAPGHPDLNHKPPLLTLEQWHRFCYVYTTRTGNEFHHEEKITARLAKVDGFSVAGKQWTAWLRWVAFYKLTGDGRDSFTTGEG